MFTAPTPLGLALRQAIAKNNTDSIINELKELDNTLLKAKITEKGEKSGKSALDRALDNMKNYLYKKKDVRSFETSLGITEGLYYTNLVAYLFHCLGITNVNDEQVKDCLTWLADTSLLQTKLDCYNAKDQALELRKAIDAGDGHSLRFILDTKSKKEAIALLESQGPKTGKTAIHRACERVLQKIPKTDTKEHATLQFFIDTALYSIETACFITDLFCKYGPIDRSIKDNEGTTISMLIAKLPKKTRDELNKTKTQESSSSFYM